MYCVLHRDAVAHVLTLSLGETVIDSERPRLTIEQLGEIRFAEPRRESRRDLETDLGRQSVLRRSGGEVNLSEPALTNESIQLVGAATLRAVRRRPDGGRARHRVQPTALRCTESSGRLLCRHEGWGETDPST